MRNGIHINNQSMNDEFLLIQSYETTYDADL